MATYIPGSSDFVPQIQPFHADLNYFSKVLQTKQSQYDQANKSLNSVYSTMLNSPMLRNSNIDRRDQFFKAVDQDIKKISGLDLSQQKNIDAAMQVFKPMYEDKYMVKDMTYSKQLQKQIQKGESFRTCIDPEKCGGSYWEEGMKALQYHAEEFKNSSDDQSLNMKAPEYVPFVNLTQKAVKAAKDAGFNISVDTNKGGYIVTDTNGNLLLNGANGKAGILPNYLLGLFKDDQKVMDVFRTKAYTARKDFVKANAVQYGSEEAAEGAYVNHVISSTVPNLEQQAVQAKKAYQELESTKGVLEDKAKVDGGMVKGSPEETSYSLLSKLLESKADNEAHHDQVLNTIDTAKNLQDFTQLKHRVDAIVAYGDFYSTLNNAAKEYAMATQKSEMKADPYELAKFNSSLSLRNTLSAQTHDFDIWKQKKTYENAELAKTLSGLGIDPSLAGKMSASDIKDIIRRRGKGTGAGLDVNPFGPIAGGAVTTGVDQNNEAYNNQAQRVIFNSSGYLKNIADAMKSSYDGLKNDSSESAKNKKVLLVNKAKEIFKGTNFDAEQFLNGNRSLDDIDKIEATSAVKSSDRATNISNEPTSFFWTSGVDNKLKADNAKDRQIFSKMLQLKKQGAVSTVTSMLADATKLGTEEFAVQRAGIASILDGFGNLRDSKSAAKFYADQAYKLYKDDPKYIQRRDELVPNYAAKTAHQKAEEDFEKNKYPEIVKQYKTQYKGQVLGGREEAGYQGGATAPIKAKSYNVSPSEDLSPEVAVANSVVSGIENNLGNPNVSFYRGDVKDPSDIKNDPATQQFAMNYLNLYKQSLGEKRTESSPAFVLKAQKLPAMKVSGDIYEEANLYKFEPNPAAIKKIIGAKEYDPSKDYSFTIKVPSEVDQSEFNLRTQQSPAQLLMTLPGQALTYEDPAKGSLTLNRDKNGFYFTGFYNSFDTKTGTYYKENVPNNKNRIPSNLNADEAYNYMQQSLNYVNSQVETIVKNYLKVKKNG